MFIVTEGMYSLEESSYEVSDRWEVLDTIDQALAHLANGDVIQIRRADYLDTKANDDVSSERPKLKLIRGGKS